MASPQDEHASLPTVDEQQQAQSSSSRSNSSISPRKRRAPIDGTNAHPNESLLKRMGGPSAAKAGLALDQAEINRRIYEASKGSKYFENERRNDERITRKVEALLARMDERLRAVPEGSAEWLAIEKKADALAAKLEATRDLSRHIVHCDMDQFYGAVELKRDPSLKGKAFGVGKGVLVTASYEARAYGCRSGMATYIAEALCPHLITVPNDMQAYVAASQEVMAIFRRFDSNLAQASLDEAYLDITDHCRINAVGVDETVAELRRQVRDETGLTVSVGVAPNTMLAKIGSDKNKPDGQFRLEATASDCVDFMKQLPVRKVPGVGRVTERILQALGVETCGDIWRLRVRIALVMGDGDLEWLLRYNLGIASSTVEPSKREERKSVGREHTFLPTSDPERLLELLRESADRVAEDLKKLDFVGKRVTLTCKAADFQRFTRDQTQTGYVSQADDIFRITRLLLEHELKLQPGLSLRLIGARVSTLKDVRKPDDGGPLRKLWSGQGASPRKRQRVRRDLDDPDKVKSANEEDDTAELEEDEEARQLRLAIAASLAEVDNDKAQEGATAASEPSNRSDAAQEGHAGPHWSPPPPAERTANSFASELRRSTPEGMRSRSSPAKPRCKTPTEDDVLDAVDERHQADEMAKSTGRSETAKAWFASASAAGTHPPQPQRDAAASPQHPTPQPPPSNAVEDPICPICSQKVAMRFGSTLSGRNAQLNAHIDACLKGECSDGKSSSIGGVTKEQEPSKAASKSRAGSGVSSDSVGKKKQQRDDKQRKTLEGFFRGRV